MIATLECPCGRVSEHQFAAMDPEKKAPCPACGRMLLTMKHRVYSADLPMIQGDTVAGGCDYNYECDTLGVVRGKRDRAEKMARMGLTDYTPDPAYKAAREESRYIREHASRGDVRAEAAAQDVVKTASNKKRKDRIREGLRKSVTKRDLAEAAKRAGFE